MQQVGAHLQDCRGVVRGQIDGVVQMPGGVRTRVANSAKMLGQSERKSS